MLRQDAPMIFWRYSLEPEPKELEPKEPKEAKEVKAAQLYTTVVPHPQTVWDKKWKCNNPMNNGWTIPRPRVTTDTYNGWVDAMVHWGNGWLRQRLTDAMVTDRMVDWWCNGWTKKVLPPIPYLTSASPPPPYPLVPGYHQTRCPCSTVGSASARPLRQACSAPPARTNEPRTTSTYVAIAVSYTHLTLPTICSV